MDTTQPDRRATAREKLIAAAEEIIAEKGLAGVNAREVTARAGCALGALYNAVDDLDTLILHVNSRTLARLGGILRESVPAQGAPEEVLQALAHAYVTFALENRRQWSALFEHILPEDHPTPEWHLNDHAVLIEQIIAPLQALRPDMPRDALEIRSRTTFGAVHGVVQLTLQGRYAGVPKDRLADEVAALVAAMARGAAHSEGLSVLRLE